MNRSRRRGHRRRSHYNMNNMNIVIEQSNAIIGVAETHQNGSSHRPGLGNVAPDPSLILQRQPEMSLSSEINHGQDIEHINDLRGGYKTTEFNTREDKVSSISDTSERETVKGIMLTSVYTISVLPDDVLYLIFMYLQPEDLCHLACVCRRFQHLASKDSVWIQHAKRTAVVRSLINCLENTRQCSAKELCRLAPNWRHGRFKEYFAIKQKTRLIPWVQRNDDGLWFSTGSVIRFFERQSSGHLREVKYKCLQGLEGDATRFLVKKNLVVSGCRDGSIGCWEVNGNLLFNNKQVHRSDTQCVDFTDRVIISGSRDTTCKILPFEASSNYDDGVVRSFEAGERVWSLKISPCERFFAAGLAGCLDDPPVVMWDIESGKCIAQLSVNHRRGAGVLDLKFESPHELLTCGYDTFIRMWDLRTKTCVAQWEEPHDSALYCVESDQENTIVVGTARHGMVRLWDKRQTEPVQAYYSNNRNSPVFSLAMDSGHLYLALDVGLNVMNFSAWRNESQVASGSSSSYHHGNIDRPRLAFKR